MYGNYLYVTPSSPNYLVLYIYKPAIRAYDFGCALRAAKKRTKNHF